MLKIIIAGPRDYHNYNVVRINVLRVLKELKDSGYDIRRDNIEIVSGHAKGVDTLGEELSKEYNFSLKIFPAEWSKFGRKSGILRNKNMAEYADILIAFDKGTRGTTNMIKTAKRLKLKVFTIPI